MSIEYFARMISNPAPFVGDSWEEYVRATSPEEAAQLALDKAEEHPAGAFAVYIYRNADSMHKNKKPLAHRDGKQPFKMK